MCARSSEEKKQYIIKNFIDLIHQYGINRVTLSDVAERSGLTKSALYYYFDSKEVLTLEGFKFFMEKMKEFLIPMFNEKDTPKETIEKYTLFHLKIMNGEFDDEFSLFKELTDDVINEREKYIMNVPTLAQAILKSRDEELVFLNDNVAKYFNVDPEDERTRKMTLLYTGTLHSYIAFTTKMLRKREAWGKNILSDFPWDINCIGNDEIVTFLMGGLDKLKEKIFG